METVAFVGLGLMGQGRARRLREKGIGLYGYNRTADRATPLVKKGAELFGDKVATVQSATVLTTMLSDDETVAELVGEEVLQSRERENAPSINRAQRKLACMFSAHLVVWITPLRI